MVEIEPAGNWLRTDELIEALNALHMVEICLENVTTDMHYWKWVIIALHNSLQGFMVCALRGSNGVSVLTDRCRNQWLQSHESGTTDKYPIERMDPFLNLYEKIKGKDMRIFVNSRQFVAHDEQDQSVDKLNEFRNEFVHFLPKLWSLEVSGLPQIAKDCLGIIKFLMLESGNIIAEPELKANVGQIVGNLENRLSELENIYYITAG